MRAVTLFLFQLSITARRVLYRPPFTCPTLPNRDTGLSQKAVDAESNLVDRPLPAIHIGEGNVCVSLLFLLVIHYLKEFTQLGEISARIWHANQH